MWNMSHFVELLINTVLAYVKFFECIIYAEPLLSEMLVFIMVNVKDLVRFQDVILLIMISFIPVSVENISVGSGIDLSKRLGGQTKILEGQMVVKSDKYMGVSQLLRARAAPPQSLRLWVLVYCCLTI